MQWKVRIMTKPDLMHEVSVVFLEAPSFEAAKKQVRLADNQVATFEVKETELNAREAQEKEKEKV